MGETKLDKRSKSRIEIRYLIVVFLLLGVIAVVLVIINVIVPVMNDRSSVEGLVKQCLQLDDEDDETIADCLEDKAFFYYSEGDCDKALMVYDYIPIEKYDDYSLADRYDEAYSLSLSCDDKSKQEYWKKKLEELSNKLEAMD